MAPKAFLGEIQELSRTLTLHYHNNPCMDLAAVIDKERGPRRILDVIGEEKRARST